MKEGTVFLCDFHIYGAVMNKTFPLENSEHEDLIFRRNLLEMLQLERRERIRAAERFAESEMRAYEFSQKRRDFGQEIPKDD